MPRVRAPEFPKNSVWLNSKRPLSLSLFWGRTVLLDFWTYGCINCLHILPDLKYLERKYAEHLTVIGIHSAKFDHERETANIRQAILRYDIEHPVLVDRHSQVWQNFAIRAYPTIVVIDPKGYVVATIAGEGKRDLLDQLINQFVEEYQGVITAEKLDLTLEKYQNPVISPLAFPGKVLADEESDRIFIADSGHHRIIVSTLEGQVLHAIGTGQAGLVDGSFLEVQFSAPQGMAFDRGNHVLYVADTENHAVRKIELEQQRVTTIAGTGIQSQTIYPHCGKDIPLNSPWDLALINDSLFIAMAGSHQIWEMQLQTGSLQTYAGTGAEGNFDGSTHEAAFAQPSGITRHGHELFVADSESSSIRAINLEKMPQVWTICGSGSLFDFGDRDGIGESVRLQHCLGIDFAQNSLWIADTYNHKIKQVDPESQSCKTVIEQELSEPSGISATRNYLYIADTNNHVIRRMNLNSFEMTTIEFPNLCAPDACFPTKNRDILENIPTR
jgi:thiol-disulfide isomerase/thioredoxin